MIFEEAYTMYLNCYGVTRYIESYDGSIVQLTDNEEDAKVWFGKNYENVKWELQSSISRVKWMYRLHIIKRKDIAFISGHQLGNKSIFIRKLKSVID